MEWDMNEIKKYLNLWSIRSIILHSLWDLTLTYAAVLIAILIRAVSKLPENENVIDNMTITNLLISISLCFLVARQKWNRYHSSQDKSLFDWITFICAAAITVLYVVATVTASANWELISIFMWTGMAISTITCLVSNINKDAMRTTKRIHDSRAISSVEVNGTEINIEG